jgi:site-specific recombinase XerD
MSALQTTTPVPGVAQAAQSFYLDREANYCTPATLKWYRKYVGALVAWLAARDVTQLHQVTPDLLRVYLVELQGRALAPRTVHHHAAAAKVFLNFAEGEGLLPAGSPMAKVRMPRLPKELLPALTTEEARALLTACECERDRAVVLVLLDSGLRAQECAALNVDDVDMTTGAVRVKAGKGRKDRTVYLGARARRAVGRYLAERGAVEPAAALWVSQTRERGRLTTWGLRQILERARDRAGLTVKVNPHTLRRTFALWSLRAGMPLPQLASIMGHADLGVLQKYLKLVEQDLQAAHDAHGAVDRYMRK